MTPRQVELARHALGLPNANRQPQRNRFLAAPRTADYAEWQNMVRHGLARMEAPPKGTSFVAFHLTRKAADAALREGETIETWRGP